jgi:hypothetical protein
MNECSLDYLSAGQGALNSTVPVNEGLQRMGKAAWRNRGNPWKTSLRKVSLVDNTLIQNLPNTKNQFRWQVMLHEWTEYKYISTKICVMVCLCKQIIGNRDEVSTKYMK